MHRVFEADKYIFRLINFKWHTTFLDEVLPFFRNSSFWLPLYLFLLVFSLVNIRRPWLFILFAICTAALTDTLSSHLIKNIIYRVRPCNEPEIQDWIRVLVSYRPTSSSFTSSHAANHFGLATFLVLTLRPLTGRWIYMAFVWAFLIVYAQIYVGVHYPLDVIGGAVVGVLAGLLTAWLYKLVEKNIESVNVKK
jgi:membrane-associated phospholipid phosphatase